MKRHIHTDQKLKDFRKDLRNNATEEEVLLWQRLKGRRMLGYKFQRQHSIGPYIVDFYCSKKKLAIEIDGHQHESNKEYDQERTLYLNRFGIIVVRFWNEEINMDMVKVLEKVHQTLSCI